MFLIRRGKDGNSVNMRIHSVKFTVVDTANFIRISFADKYEIGFTRAEWSQAIESVREQSSRD